jgi:hypothetical protein
VAKPDSTQATETLHEIESIFDRLASWVGQNPVPVLVGIGVALALAAGVGGFRAFHADREADASAAVAEIQADYLEAMGAPAGSLDVPEPANAEAAAATRREFAVRFREAAERERDREGAIAAWRAASENAPGGSTLQALARTRLAGGLEAAGDSAAAAAEYLAAGQVPDFPGRVRALGDAARAFADAGQTERALEVFGGIADEDARELPPHVASRLAELEVRSQAGR